MIGMRGSRGLAVCLLVCLGAALSPAAGEAKLPPGHAWVHFRLRITDTHSKGISAESVPIEIRRFVAEDYKLDHVEPLRPQAGEAVGVFVGKVPIDDQDERSLQVLKVHAPGFQPFRFPPKRLRKGETREDAPYRFEATLARDYTSWRPRFEQFSKLAKPIAELLDRSPQVEYLPVSDQMAPVPVGRLVDKEYDHPRVRLETNVRDAKAGLLNIMAALEIVPVPKRSAVAWRDYIEVLRRFNEERIVVRVRDDMFDLVRDISNQSEDQYECSAHETVSSQLHGRSFYNLFPGDPRAETISIKLPLCQGSLQLTLCQFRKDPDGTPLGTFADIDIDQNRGVAHWLDAASQHNRKPTSPMLIFDMLGGALRGRDIGYSLERAFPR